MQNKKNPKFKSEQRRRTHLQTQYIQQSLMDTSLILKFSPNTLESKYYLFTSEKTKQNQKHSSVPRIQSDRLGPVTSSINIHGRAKLSTKCFLYNMVGGGGRKQQMCRMLPPTHSIPCPRLTSGICHSPRSC